MISFDDFLTELVASDLKSSISQYYQTIHKYQRLDQRTERSK